MWILGRSAAADRFLSTRTETPRTCGQCGWRPWVRRPSRLRVLSAHAEDEAPGNAAAELPDELALMARWLGLGHVAVHPRGDMAPGLASAVAARQDGAS